MRTNHQQRVMLSRKSKDLQQLCEDYATNPEQRNDLLKYINGIDFSNAKTTEVCTVAVPCLVLAVAGFAFVAAAVASVGLVAGAWTVAMCSHIGLPCEAQLQHAQFMADVVSYRNLV
jgi:hypothetical protein